MGHQLKEYYPPESGDFAFRDDRQAGEKYECDLRFGVDVVISVGYRDTRNWTEVWEEDLNDETDNRQ